MQQRDQPIVALGVATTRQLGVTIAYWGWRGY